MGVEFGVTPRVVSSVYEHVENILFTHASKNLFFLGEEANKATMPESFKKNYPDCRAIIDCFEIKTEVPSKVDHAVLGYSHYKKSFTIKVLVCIAPCGLIQFISQGFGGRATDGQITIMSGFIYFVKYGMKIMADKVAFYSLKYK